MKQLKRTAKSDAIEGFFSAVESEVLGRYARQVSGALVEIGSYKGLTTSVLAQAARETGALVYAIDPHFPYTDPHPGGIAWSAADNIDFLRNIAPFGDVVRIVNLHSYQVSRGWTAPIGLLFIDGSHAYEDVKRDFREWEPYISDDGYIAIHDTRSIPDVKRFLGEVLAADVWTLAEQIGELAVLKRA